MKKKLPYLLPSFVFFLGAPLVWLLCFREVPLRVSPETTHITQPLTKDGKSIDWFRAIKERFEPKCKPEDNGFRMVAAALGKSPYFEEPDWYWPELCRELDLDPNLAPTLKFEPLVEYINREYLIWLDENEDAASIDDSVKLWGRLFNEPWTIEEFPFMTRWIEENSLFLDLVAEAVRKEYFFAPELNKPGNVATSTMFSRFFKMLRTIQFDFSLAFKCRMQFQLGKGNVDGAWRDAMSSSYMLFQAQRSLIDVEFYSNSPFLRHQLKIVQDQPLSPEQRKRFLADLDALPPFKEISDVLLKDRFYILHTLADKQVRYINWNLVATRVNRFYDMLDLAAKETDPTKRDDILKELKNGAIIAPKRSRLGKLVGKPITVDERSKELAWAVIRGAGGLSDLALSNHRREGELDELRKRLEDENHEP